MSTGGPALSLRDHFAICATGLMGASAAFALSGGNWLAATLVGLYAAGLARSQLEYARSGYRPHDQVSLLNVASYLKSAPRSTLKKTNDAGIVVASTVAGGVGGGLLGAAIGMDTGLLAVPFTLAVGASAGALAGHVAGHAVRFLSLGAASLIEGAWIGAKHLSTPEEPDQRHASQPSCPPRF